MNPDVLSPAALTHLRWSLISGVGPTIFARLLERFGDAQRAWEASFGQLAEIRGIGSARADAIAIERGSVSEQAELDAARQHGVRIICREDPEYPPLLLRTPDPPIVLYVRGSILPTDAVSVAIVGSRRCSIYGSEQARRFGELLAGAGFTVVSGLARGIDAFAQHGAVDAGGRSLAVLGNGLTHVYPPENAALAERIVQIGALLSELPLRASVRAENFPARNRLIAGITLGTLVVEAASRSGALITARFATEYNREVFAIPGRAQEATAIGVNRLIRDGARLVTCLEDILEELGDVGAVMRPAAPPEAQATLAASRPPATLTPAESTVFAQVGAEPTVQDLILARISLPTGEALAAFTSLELKGLIRRLPGARFARTGQ